MSKYLVIVESPNKIATIKKYLNNDYLVMSSIGHIRDLPSNSSFAPPVTRGTKLSQDEKLNNKVLKMGINPYTWDGDFQIMQDKTKVVSELKAAAKNCDIIYLATDLDREGEAIAWHLQEILGKDKVYKRVIFNEITKTAIQKAFKNPIDLNIDRVHAQQTRRYLDRIVGFLLTPLLFSKAGKGLSAGRVQSVATRLIVERDREIRKFVPLEYWNISTNAGDFEFDLHSINGQRLTSPNEENAFFIPNQEETNLHVKNLHKGKARISNIEVKDTSKAPRAPFTTSTLQQRASTLLGYDVRTTMSLAQSLYEQGYITYMRTDSVNISEDAKAMAESYIKEQWGEEFWDPNRSYSTNNANSQEAHEAIRPTDVTRILPSTAKGYRLYNLIRQQFLSSLMSNAIFQNTSICVQINEGNDYILRFSASLLKFPGFQKAFGRDSDSMFDFTKNLKVGDAVNFLEFVTKQNYTSPPSHYTEAALVKELEKRSIGRPSTYASIISTIQDRGYVTIENKRFTAEKIAEIVTDSLEVSFPNIMDYDFTAQMENDLDAIANGEKDWHKELNVFWEDFKKRLIQAELPADEGGFPPKQLVETKFKCPSCKKHNMALQFSKAGTFLTCLGYELKGDDKCRCSLTIFKGDNIIGDQDSSINPDDITACLHKPRCPKCNSTLDEYFINEHNKIYICSNISRCTYTHIEEGNYLVKSLSNVPCDKCGTIMEVKNGPFGRYMHCSNCDNKRGISSDGKLAPPKKEAIAFPELPCSDGKSFFVLRNSARGIFLGANTYPKCRELKRVSVEVLNTYRDRLTDDLQYLADAPLEDNLGNKTVVKYDTKQAKQYIGSCYTSEKDTRYRADYIDGTWQVIELAKEESSKDSSSNKIAKPAATSDNESTVKAKRKVTSKTTKAPKKKTITKTTKKSTSKS